MKKKKAFKAVIEDAGSGGAFVTVPFEVEAYFGKKRVKIRAQIESEVYRGSLVRMEGKHHLLLIRKDIRNRIGKTIGDLIDIS